MRMLNNKGMKVVVLTSMGGGCPRIKITRNNVQLRDDYNGRIKTTSKLLNKLLL